jgi:hypothetical protein
MIGFATLLSSLVMVTTIAGAAQAACTQDSRNNHLYATWFDYPGDNNVGGVRAGIQVRKDGAICSTGGGVGTGLWIGLQEENLLGNHLYQAGFFWILDSQGSPHMCKFWEAYPNNSHLYGDCAPDANAYYYWKVFKYTTGSGKDLAIEDCGKADNTYSTCTTEDFGRSEDFIPDDFAEVSSETLNSGCQNNMMGDLSNPANIGNGSNPIEVEHDAGDPWIQGEIFQLETQDGETLCSHYHKNLPSPQVLAVWDDRNVN